ncbi:MAG: hypothetical protein ACRC0F_04415 [Cetobacterium sp.]
MKLYMYGGALFDVQPKDFDFILHGRVDINALKKYLKNITFNSFGGMKIKIKDTIVDLAIVEEFDDDVFLDKFVELNSDFVYYDIEEDKFHKHSSFVEYERTKHVAVRNPKNIHPTLGVERRQERMRKTSCIENITPYAYNHLGSNVDLKYFIRVLKICEVRLNKRRGV